MGQRLIQIGTSKGVIIPARLIKKRNYTENTEFEIIERGDGILLRAKAPSLDSLDWPKVDLKTIPDKPDFLKDFKPVPWTEEEISRDPRLAYLLNKYR